MWDAQQLEALGLDFDPARNSFTYTFPPPHIAKKHGTIGAARPFADCADWQDFSLYIHIPFCEINCDFCSLHREVLRDRQRCDRYLDALARELAACASLVGDIPLSAIFFGGGTPTVLTTEELSRILDQIAHQFRCEPDVEVCIECAPSQGRTSDDWRAYIGSLARRSTLPLTRVSFGVQSFDEQILQRMGRRGGLQGITRLLQAADDVLETYNIDLILGYPEARSGLSSREIAESLVDGVRRTRAGGVRLPSISFYQLWDTDTIRMSRGPNAALPAARSMLEAKAWLQQEIFGLGYHPTIVSTVVTDMRHSHRWVKHRHLAFRHIGVGSGIYSILPGELVQRPRDIEGYTANAVEGMPFRDDIVYSLSAEEKLMRYVIMGLRSYEWVRLPLPDGSGTGAVDTGAPADDLSETNLRELDQKLDALIGVGLVEREGERIRLSPNAFFIANEISTFLHPSSHPRMSVR